MDEKAIPGGIPKPSANKNQVPVLEELISDLVHKLNNPLSSIRGFSELILSKTKDPGIKKEAILELLNTAACERR